MSDYTPSVDVSPKESEKLQQIHSKGFVGKLSSYARLTGPGWLQAAVTLGGGSLASALYLGVISGYSLMWLQPLAMLCGVIMLMALAHVTLGNKKYPFTSVKETISPVLAWSWLGATVVADVVFCAAQASLGVAAVQQNLGININAYIITIILSAIGLASAALYALGSNAVKQLEFILKILVGIVIVCFAAAAVTLLFSGKVNLGAIFAGLIPNPMALFKPATSLDAMIAATGPSADYWNNYVTDLQRSRIIAAFGTAVGINMTFLLPYTLVKRGWGKVHRELSRFDLVIALFLPFSLATGLLVICAASSFHGQTTDVLDSNGRPVPSLEAGYYKILNQRLVAEGDLPVDPAATREMANQLPLAERELAAALTNRDAKQLSNTLAPIMGQGMADLVFGVGILAMALSTMMVHMLMNGFAISQSVGKPGKFKPFVIGASMPALLAIFAPFVWSGDAKAALQIPAAVIATTLLPIAYLAILLLMNSRKTLQDGERASPIVNILMVISAGIATFASFWLLSHKGTAGMIGIAGLILLALTGVFGFWRHKRKA
ncbi:divalent metal cation transporter [Rubellicoccus peritrichatus]|uniref:Divalent metal cation transporter n=1 Tax=Rubellicoccus peritrichatus TaxID=3080537 RepID=A0AAQ3L7B6_9BACT|nr:divalent metal cation transporter [Puniceicoccus sp. CR14]WOO39972.1 divalent metal cation transporter [Puniceicoccus sp. CR14]